MVVNCFQICNFTKDSQSFKNYNSRVRVVNCFQICNFTKDSQSPVLIGGIPMVVNCFQICNFTKDSQCFTESSASHPSCELLSDL